MSVYFNDKNVFHKGKGRNVLCVGGKVLVAEVLQGWRVKRGQGLPCAGQMVPAGFTTDPLQDTPEPISQPGSSSGRTYL